MTYFTTLTAVVVLSYLAGFRLSRRLPGKPRISNSVALAVVAGICGFWFGAAWLARPYSDGDRPGWQLAEWYAHTGKWWVLLASAVLGHGVAQSLKQIPSSLPRRNLYWSALLIVVSLVGWRTIPVYLLLPEGRERRDSNGYLRQSLDHEYTCAGVALVNYLERHRGVTNLTERFVTQVCGTTVEGTTTMRLLRGARVFGLTNATARMLNWNELVRHKLPVVVYISTLPQVRHATLLVKIDPQLFHFIDPAYGSWNVSPEFFRQVWFGKTVLLD